MGCRIRGTFGSEGDRLAVKNFLKEVKPGQSVAAVVSDPSFSNLDEETLALFESLGAGELRAAAAANSKWGFFGNKGLKPGDGYESVGEVQISTVTETVTDVNFAPNADQDFDGRPVFLRMPASVADAYSRFLTRYETLRIRDDMNILTVYDKTDEIVYAKRADGMSTYYDLGKMRETYTDRGDLSYVYDYDCPAGGCKTGEDMQLKKITLVKARNDFERETQRLNEEIEQAKFDALYRLAWQDEVARLKIKEEVNSGLAAITAEIRRLEPMQYQEVTQCSSGWCGEECSSQTVENTNVTSAINNLYSQREELWRTQQEQLAKLPGEIAAKKLEIEQASSSAVQDLEKKKAEILFDLLQKEIQPILMDYYRRILGRDPSTQEESDWINRFKDTQAVDVALLESELGGSLEKRTREEERAALIAGVESFLRDYLTLTESQKAARLTALQLSPPETVSLDSAEVESILTYLKSRGLHFGQSAFLSLRSMLLARGVDAPMAPLGLEAVLIDILTGTINPLTEGELLVSVFAMNRVAKIHGREFAGVRYSFDDLKALYNNACPSGGDCGIRVIARVGEDHFVVVTKVTDTEVTCFETGKGKDGEAVTMTRDSFVKAWKAEEDGKGYLVVDAKDSTAANRLTDEEAQRIRGSFWPLVFFIAALVLTAVSAIVSPYSPTLGKILGIAAMVAGILSIVASVGSWVVQGAKMAYGAMQQGFFQTVWAGLKGVGNFLVQSVRYVGRFFQEGFQFVKATFSQGLSKLGPGIISAKNFVLNPAGKEIIVNGVKTKLFTTGQQAARSLIAVGINMGVSRGLEGLGLNPALANLAGAFTGFGAIGLGSGLSGFIKSGLQGMMLAGVSEMGLKLNLPPPITGAISLLTSATLKSYFDPALTLKTALTDIAPQVSSQFVLGGMDLLGRSLGMDWRVSRLIGLPISAAVGGLVDSLSYANSINPTSIFAAIKNGLAAGAASIGFDFSGKTTDALFGSLKSGNILGSVESALGQNGLFSNILNLLGQAALVPFNAVSGAVNAALNGLTDFGSLIQSKGIIGAFDSLATSIFSRQTIERLLGSGGIGGVLSTAAKVLTTLDGQSVQEQNLGGGTSLFYDFAGKFIGKKEKGVTQIGTFGVTNTGQWGLLAGKLIGELLGGTVFAGEISDGQLMHGTLSGADGVFGEFNPEGGKGPIIIDKGDQWPIILDGRDNTPASNQGGSFWNLMFKFLPYAVDYIFSQGTLKETHVNQTTQSGAASGETITKTSKFLFGNGFNNAVVPEGTLDTLIPPYAFDLSIKDHVVDLLKTVFIPLYETTDLVGNMADWLSDFYFRMQDEEQLRQFIAGGVQGLADTPILLPIKSLLSQIGFGIKNSLIDEVWGKMVQQESVGGRLEDGIAFSHSGFFSPLINALAKPKPDGAYFDVETIINYEGVHPGFNNHNAFIDNPNLKRIINVWGTEPLNPTPVTGQMIYPCDASVVDCIDESKKPVPVSDFGPPTSWFENAAFTGPGNITNINIEIKNARHNDFSYDPTEWNEPGNQYEPERKAQEINRLTNLFMRRLYKAVVDEQITPNSVTEFLNSLVVQGTAKYENGTWKIDFGEV